jgi:hypothetical protein
MNERIQELAFKAYNNAGQGTPEALSSFMEVYSEKFAELIVQECNRITEEAIAYELENSADLNPFFIKREINKHFGVEK